MYERGFLSAITAYQKMDEAKEPDHVKEPIGEFVVSCFGGYLAIDEMSFVIVKDAENAKKFPSKQAADEYMSFVREIFNKSETIQI